MNCSGLTSITIPNSVTSIGNNAFSGCTNVNIIVDANNKTVKLINGLLICDNKLIFCSAKSLGNIIIPNSITSIGDYAFRNCSGLTSVTIPNSVTSIGCGVFYGCSKLNTVIWNAKNLNSKPFCDCYYITEVYIGDDVQTLYDTFASTTSIKKIVLGKNVEYIRQDAFKGCSGLEEFYVTGEDAPYLYPNVFSSITLSKATLYVPNNKAEYYKTTAPWNEFGNILDLEGNEPEMPIKEQCAKPTVKVENGKLKFMCETEGAVLHYTISCSDAVSNVTENNIEVNLTKQYIITFFATADGYDKSETVVEAITLGNASTVDVNADGSVDTQDVLEIYEYMKTHAKERKEIDEYED